MSIIFILSVAAKPIHFGGAINYYSVSKTNKEEERRWM